MSRIGNAIAGDPAEAGRTKADRLAVLGPADGVRATRVRYVARVVARVIWKEGFSIAEYSHKTLGFNSIVTDTIPDGKGVTKNDSVTSSSSSLVVVVVVVVVVVGSGVVVNGRFLRSLFFLKVNNSMCGQNWQKMQSNHFMA